MERPNSLYGPHNGLLRVEQFQIAYATKDIEAAKKLFQNQLGIKAFKTLEGPLPAGGYVRAELAWVGNTMYELLTADGPGSEVYAGRVQNQDHQLVQLHHFGFLVNSAEEWSALMAEIEKQSWPMPNKSLRKGFISTCFVDCTALGHYLEYIWPEPAGLDFLTNAVPYN